MKMSWSVGPEAQRVELEATLTGEEIVSVNAVPVLNRSQWALRSEHELPVAGHSATMVIEFQLSNMDYTASLVVDGALVQPEKVESRSNGLTAAAMLGAGAIVAIATSSLLGVMLAMALMVGLVAAVLLRRSAPRTVQPLVPAVCVLWAQTVGGLVNLAVTGAYELVSYGEVAAFLILGVFLMRRPTRTLVIVTTVLEAVTLCVLLWVFSSYVGMMQFGLILNLLLRIAVIFSLNVGWQRLSEQSAAGPAPDAARPTPS